MANESEHTSDNRPRFLDETGSILALTPLYARAPKRASQSKGAAQPWEEYDADCGPLAFRDGSRHDLGRINEHNRL